MLFPSPSNFQPPGEGMPPIQPFGTQIHLLSLDTQIHPLSSSSRQAPTHPLEVQALHGQKQTTALSNQRSNSQKQAEPAPHTSHLLFELPKGRQHPQALPMPPISCTNSGTSTSEHEEYSHCVGDERVGFIILFYFDQVVTNYLHCRLGLSMISSNVIT